jgi:NAD(P)-dependent dehydrogenase (short-subunit alcohol dehydrogenase family)
VSDTGALEGSVVVLTGASAGLGAQLADALDRAGASVVLAARRADAIAERAGRMRSALAVPCDVTRDGDRQRLVAAAVERFGGIDGLVNNAGVIVGKPAHKETVEDLTRQLDTNLVAPFALSGLVLASMRERGGGSIVNVASTAAFRSIDGWPQAGYAASKAGLVGLTRELASQWGRFGVRVNAVAPGVFPTEMSAATLGPDAALPDHVRAGVPLARAGRPGELDEAVVYLLGDGASFVTGQTLAIDGGLVTR